MQTPGSIAAALATMLIHGLPDDYYATLRRRYLEATVDEVSAAAATHLHPAALTVVVEGDETAVAPSLADVG
jgi:predicted Zn-dependent peptidase